MRPYVLLLPLLASFLLWTSCRKDLTYAPSAGNLEFSKDTVFLDTVFATIGSSTYTLKVYNRTRDDIEIPSIRLGQGAMSSYRLNVDGMAGKEFYHIPLYAQDSLFIFIETTRDLFDVGQTTFLDTDVIQFDSGGYLQEVQLVTLIQDAIFLFPGTRPDGSKETILLGLGDQGQETRVAGFDLADEQLNFTNEKPYVIYGYAVVPEGQILRIASGSRVHFHKDSGILVRASASLQVTGELSSDNKLLENEVIFEGDRLEPQYGDLPGQWGTIWLSKGSVQNSLDHATIKNATIGLLVEGDPLGQAPTLTIKNTQIYNSAAINLWAQTATIAAENCVFGSAGNSSLFCELGGDYSFLQTTIANYWRHGYRTGASLSLSNLSRSQENNAFDLVRADFKNCIIDGNGTNELSLLTNDLNLFNFKFSHSLLKYQDNEVTAQNPNYDFQNILLYDQVYRNLEADFLDSQRDDFRIGGNSAALGKADLDAAALAPIDLLGMDRTVRADCGAYQVILEN
ncbi:MAG: hypothetical protein MUO53_14445 [Maribacter sp.]|nr:hypothetical protein [Maribacter sp.]